MSWSSGIGSLAGSVIAGPAGAFVGHLVGGLAGKMVEQRFDTLSQPVIEAIDLTVGEGAGERLRKIGRRLQQHETNALHQAGDALQIAFRDAFINAIHDVGGAQCFPVVWREMRRDDEAPFAYAATPEGHHLWQMDNPLAEQICAFLSEMVRAVQAGQMLADAGGDDGQEHAYRYLHADTEQVLAMAFFDEVVAPYVRQSHAAQALLADLHHEQISFEAFLRHTLPSRTLWHLGHLVKERDAAWRTFNELVLMDMSTILDQVLARQAVLQQDQRGVLQRLKQTLDQLVIMVPTSGWSSDVADLIAAFGMLEKTHEERFDAVLDRLMSQHQDVISRLATLMEQNTRLLDTMTDTQERVTDILTIVREQTALATPHLLRPKSDIHNFTDRHDDQTALQRMLQQAIEGMGPTIGVVTGMPGVGKSALAIYMAYQLKDRFPDGQLYCDLRGGYSADLAPLDTTVVLAIFLQALGIDAEAIPLSLVERASLYRSLLAQRFPRTLVLLDNVQNTRQVSDLLPSGSHCAALITSQHRLDALDGAEVRNLQVMSEGDAIALLERLISPTRVTQELEAARKIVTLCGRLPLALRIAGGWLSGKTHWTLAEYGQQLENERQRLGLRLEHLEVRASFLVSYRELAERVAHLFRWLGLLPSPVVAPEIVGVLVATSTSEVRELLEQLVDAQLLEYVADGYYRMHDLLHLFARERLEDEENAAARQAAQLRLGVLYMVLLQQMTFLPLQSVAGQYWQVPEVQPVQPQQKAEAITPLQALSWFDREQDNLLATVSWCYKAGAWDVVLQLVSGVGPFCVIRALWVEWQSILELALKAGQASGNRASEGWIRMNLGIAYQRQGHWDKAVAAYEQNLQLRRALGDRHGEGQVLCNLGNVYTDQGRWQEAIHFLERGLQILKESADRYGEAIALMNLGNIYGDQGRWDKAIAMHEEGLQLRRALDDRHGEGQVFGNLGIAYLQQSHWEEAIGYLDQGLQIMKELGDRHGEALDLMNLGIVYTSQGRWQKAITNHKQVLQIMKELGDRFSEASAYSNLGNTYQKQGRWKEALASYEQSLSIRRELGDRHGEGTDLANIGAIYGVLGRWEEAVSNHEQSLKIAKLAGDRHGESIALANLSIIHTHQGHWKEAIDYSKQGLQIMKELGDRHSEGQALINLGAVYTNLGQWGTAIDCLEQGLQIKKKLGDRHGEGQALINLGAVYTNLDRWEEAVNLWQQAKSMLYPDSAEYRTVTDLLQRAIVS